MNSIHGLNMVLSNYPMSIRVQDLSQKFSNFQSNRAQPTAFYYFLSSTTSWYSVNALDIYVHQRVGQGILLQIYCFRTQYSDGYNCSLFLLFAFTIFKHNFDYSAQSHNEFQNSIPDFCAQSCLDLDQIKGQNSVAKFILTSLIYRLWNCHL